MYKSINGNNIRYDEYGANNKYHVLFIHGLGSSSIVWRDIPEALSSKFHTISVDLIGFGGSDKPKEDYTISFFSQFIKDFLNTIGIDPQEKICIIGHSLGGYIALDFTIKNTERIDKMVLFNSSGLLGKPTPLLWEYLDAVKTKDKELRRNKITKVLGQLLADPSRLLPVIVDIFISVIETPGAKDAFESAFNNSTSTTIDSDQIKKLRNVESLIIWGEKDKLIPVTFMDEFKKLFTTAQTIVIKDAGHSPFIEKPAIIHQKLWDFLQ